MNANQKKKVGAGWLRTSQDGNTEYISIVIDGGLSPDISLVMFRNGYKKADQQPDYILYLSPPRPANGQVEAPEGRKPVAAEFPESAGDDEIPF